MADCLANGEIVECHGARFGARHAAQRLLEAPMAVYSLNVKLESLKAIKTRSAEYDQDYAHMELLAVQPTTRAVRWQQSAKCHPHQNVTPGSTVYFSNFQEGWNEGEPWNQQLSFYGVADEDDLIASTFFVVNQSGETHSDRAKERFEKTVDAFSRGVEIGAVTGGALAIIFPPVGAAVAAVAGALRTALEAAKKVFDWLHGDDPPPVICDGEVLSGSWSKSVSELLPQPLDGTRRFVLRTGSQTPTPAGCGGGPDSELTFAVTASLVPEFNQAFLPGDPHDQKIQRIVGGSNAPWNGRWGDAVDERSCRIIVDIDAPPDPQPRDRDPNPRAPHPVVFRRFKITIEEHDGSHGGPIVLQKTVETVKTVGGVRISAGNLAMRAQPCDTLDLGDGLLMHLFAVQNKYGVIVEYRIQYVRKPDSPGAFSGWLVHASRIN